LLNDTNTKKAEQDNSDTESEISDAET